MWTRRPGCWTPPRPDNTSAAGYALGPWTPVDRVDVANLGVALGHVEVRTADGVEKGTGRAD